MNLYTTNLTKFIGLSTFFCIILYYAIDEYYLNLISTLGIVSFGIIHGANDLILLKKNKKTISFKSFLAGYLAVVIISVLIFYLIPTFSIVFFILFSSYHFGEQQWTMLCKSNSKKIKLFYFFYGLLLFSTLFALHKDYVNKIICDITKISIDTEFLIALFFLSLIGSIISFIINFKELKTQLIHQFILTVILITFFFSSSLIWFFGVYFVIWHSIPSIIEQSKFIYGASTKESFIKYLKDALIYWSISIIGLLIAYYLLKNEQELLISIFFSFLAAITFPHTFVIFKIKGKNLTLKS
ncbi:MAG: Brp/Blh family beta-carotene 15,15'-monooxygenase [Flavobacteriales bacterium]|jgi:Brp/Blh family beta-carotene 15,15'-monooxygenase